MGIFHIWVTTLTFLGHVTSSVTWPFDSSGAISFRCSTVTESLSPTIFEIIGIFHIWVKTLTFLGHVTSSVTWPIDPPYVIFYWCPIVTKPLSLTVFVILGPQIPCARAHTHAHAHTHTHTNTHKRILMGNRRKMALWGIVMRTTQTCGETIKWPRGESALPHKTIVCITFSIAFARWRYQFPHRDTQRQQWLPNHQSDRRRFVDTVLGVVGGLVQYLLTASWEF